MADSSPAAGRSPRWPSPGQPLVPSVLPTVRNTELSHQDALEAARAEHDRVRETAIRVFYEHKSQEEHKRLKDEELRIQLEQRREEERIRLEKQLRVEEERLRVLKLTKVPKLQPEPPTPSAPIAQQPNGSIPTHDPTQSTQPSTVKSGTASNMAASLFGSQQPTASNGTIGHPGAINGVKIESLLSQPPGPSPAAPQAKPPRPLSPFAQPFKPAVTQVNGIAAPIPTGPDRYIEIHKNLKKLRASLTQQSKLSPALKQRMGDMRRELRKNMGQLVGEKGGNRQQLAAIQALFDQSLDGTVPSQLVDPSEFITDKREPVEGARYNEPQLPSLYIYLLNHFAKAVINQFINECGAQPKTADPIGVVVAMVFSKEVYLWRGKSLIDILMAKFRVACPVLFGYRGSEKTEQGRLRLGWKKGPGGWVLEQQHVDRMKGLAAGYAAISLRNFSASKNTNPWPPSKYWTAMAKIVNTPPAEISNTQCVVLRSMIETNEERFIQFYGSAAIAALRKALKELPSKAVEQTPGVKGLKVLGVILERDIGLEL